MDSTTRTRLKQDKTLNRLEALIAADYELESELKSRLRQIQGEIVDVVSRREERLRKWEQAYMNAMGLQ